MLTEAVRASRSLVGPSVSLVGTKVVPPVSLVGGKVSLVGGKVKLVGPSVGADVGELVGTDNSTISAAGPIASAKSQPINAAATSCAAALTSQSSPEVGGLIVVWKL